MNRETIKKIFLIIGPTGVGKSVTVKGILNKMPSLMQLPSYTTRSKRPVEKKGEDHFFVSLEGFKKLIKDGELIEYEEVHPGLFYGVPWEPTKTLLKKTSLIRDVDILGSLAIKKAFPDDVVLIFMKPLNKEVLKQRLIKRGGLDKKAMEERLARVDFEMSKAGMADYQVINNDLGQCVQETINIINKELN